MLRKFFLLFLDIGYDIFHTHVWPWYGITRSLTAHNKEILVVGFISTLSKHNWMWIVCLVTYIHPSFHNDCNFLLYYNLFNPASANLVIAPFVAYSIPSSIHCNIDPWSMMLKDCSKKVNESRIYKKNSWWNHGRNKNYWE